VRRVKHEEFVREPVDTIRGLFEWAELPASPAAERYAAASPRVNTTRPQGAAPGGLRNPDGVRAAIESTAGLGALLAALGYS
jgi:hypothetical protein